MLKSQGENKDKVVPVAKGKSRRDQVKNRLFGKPVKRLNTDNRNQNHIDLSIVEEEKSFESEEQVVQLKYKQVYDWELRKIYKSNLLRNINPLEKRYKEDTNLDEDLGELKEIGEETKN